MERATVKVLAIIPCYNEADIIPPVLDHLHSQGIDTYVIDNWSTDNTTAMIQALSRGIRDGRYIRYEQFPNKPVHVYQWERILRRVEEVAQEYSRTYDWMMLHDADEIRRLPQGLALGISGKPATLVDGLLWAEHDFGANVIDFKVYNFPPTNNEFIPALTNPERHFTHYQPQSQYDNIAQEKCWKVVPGLRPDLASTGGHRVSYPEPWVKRLCPHKFITKHYPIRSQAHGERKVFEERVKRWHLGERGRNWHTQYDGLELGHNFLARVEDLVPDPCPPSKNNE